MLLLFFFNDTATTEIYTLSLHDALPIYNKRAELVDERAQEKDPGRARQRFQTGQQGWVYAVHGKQKPNPAGQFERDRKSTRLNSSHVRISYAVFCLKKKKSPPVQYLKET